MNHFLRLLTGLLLVGFSFPAASVTQEEFDRAVACCWGIAWTNRDGYGDYYCKTSFACANGESCCTSNFFLQLSLATNGTVNCSILGGEGGSTASMDSAASGEADAPLFRADGTLDLAALASSGAGAGACGAEASPVFERLGANRAGASTNALAPVDVSAVNAANVSVERLYLEENEGAETPIIGFLPFEDRFAVEDGVLYAVGFSADKGFELVEVRDVGGPKVHDFNPEGSSFAGYPHYDHRTIKGFDDGLWFYARNAAGEFSFSSLSNGSALKSRDVDPAGDDVPLVYEDASGALRYQDFHIESFEVLRGRLTTAGSERVRVLAADGSELAGPRLFDVEPQRIGPGRKSQPELVDVTRDGQSFPRNFVAFNGAVYFIAKTAGGYSFCGEDRDYELARLNDDGSAEIIEINPEGFGFYPDVEYPPMEVIGDDLYLVANLGPLGSDRHELVRITPSHDVAVVPINADGGAFRNVDELYYSFAWPNVSGAFHRRGNALYIFGANVSGACSAGCADPYEPEIVKVEAGGVVSVIDPTPGGVSTYPTFDSGFFPPRFIVQEFAGASYFFCGFCNDQPLYRLNADDSLETFPEWPVSPVRSGGEEAIGVERDGKLYFGAHRLEFEPQFIDEYFLVRVDSAGEFTSLTSPDLGFNFIYEMLRAGDTILLAANVFSDPVPDWETNFLGGELLVLHPDDTLGYVEIAPGFDEQGYPNASYPQSLRRVGDAVTFASYTDAAFASPFNELFRVQIDGKGRRGTARPASATVAAAGGPERQRTTWPSARPPNSTAALPERVASDGAGIEPGRLLDLLDAEPRLSESARMRDAFAQRSTLARRPADLAWSQLRPGPADEAYAAHARRLAEARNSARAPAEGCSAPLD